MHNVSTDGGFGW